MTDATTSTPAPVSATIPSPTIWLPYSVTATAPPPTKPPEPEVTVGPWQIERLVEEDYGNVMAVVARHQDTGEQRIQRARIAAPHADAADVARRLLRAWVDDLNAAEREDQIA